MRLCVVLIGVVLVACPGCLEKTIYAKGFPWDNYRRIQAGMTRREVLDLLGPPLFKTTYTYQLLLEYSSSSHDASPTAGEHATDQGERVHGQFWFDKEGRLVSMPERYADNEQIRLGMTVSLVKEVLGEPDRVFEDPRDGDLLFYATQDPEHPHSDYENVTVFVGTDGIVKWKEVQRVTE
jgi:outer membrane protein assembly factor BamE (lipoprotein component of BamABCDE complex)